MKVKSLFIVIFGSLWLCLPAFADAPADKGVQRTEVVILDDWPGVEPISPGTLTCPGGELEMLDPVTPFCAASGRVHMRDVTSWSCFTSEDLRVTGVGMYTANGNLDAAYTGPVWGEWMIVPSQGCDPMDLIEPTVYWKGKWHGERLQYCDLGPCIWIGDLDVLGKGHGGDIDGIHFKGTELITTYTPLPIPWEFVPGLPVTGPEGILTVTIKE